MAKKSSIRIRSKRVDGGLQIRTLIAHPMENGRRRDKVTGELVPAHFIQEIYVKHNDQLIVSANLGGAMAKDPFFTFLLKEAQEGDTITISWRDNLQLSDSKDYVVK